MQSDDVIWQIINHQFCSFKSKLARERSFCSNPYNVTGLCLRSACPLANSSYATIREMEGICYLFIKTAERAHTPKKLWEKIKLPVNYMQALEIVSNRLEHFPKYLVHRSKQRLTKIHQMLIRMRKLKLKARPKIVTTSTRNDQVEVIRERKALKAAQLDRAIENELLERLKQVSETEIYNYPEKQYNKILKRVSDKISEKEIEMEEQEQEVTSKGSYRNVRAAASKLVEEEVEDELDTMDGEVEKEDEDSDINEMEDEEDEGEGRFDMDGDYNVEFVEDFEESEDEEEDDDVDIEDTNYNLRSSKPSSKPPSIAKKNNLKSVSFQESTTKQDSKKRKAADAIGKGKKSSKPRTKGPRVEIEYEDEIEIEDEDKALSIQTIIT